MGTKNRQRRAAKAKRRARQHTTHRHHGGARSSGQSWFDEPTQPLQRDIATGLLRAAAVHPDARRRLQAFEALLVGDPVVVDREAEGLILVGVAVLWDNGWQPTEVVRLGRRADARIGRLMALAVAADHARRDPATLHPRWAAQLDELALPDVDGATGWIAGLRRAESLDRATYLLAVVGAVGAVLSAGPLHRVLPPPGCAGQRVRVESSPTVDDPILVKVRALLAQAESTTFEAEAEAFTAKAQELMARHAIDAALLWASTERDERPTTIRIPIDDPYAGIKTLLLQHVARHSRCTAVWDDRHGLSTVVGFGSDVASTEMLYTSLLVQSQAALRAEGAKAGPGARTRSRGFRGSFLMAFTHRIDGRLAEINEAIERAAVVESSDALLPVLASRHDAVTDRVTELFGTLRSVAVSGGSDAAGWARGTLAADLAKLNAADLARAENRSDDRRCLCHRTRPDLAMCGDTNTRQCPSCA